MCGISRMFVFSLYIDLFLFIGFFLEIINKFDNLIITEGSNVRFFCEVIGVFKSIVLWRKSKIYNYI